jgi:putative SOS response-associated peptidase YedK
MDQDRGEDRRSAPQVRAARVPQRRCIVPADGFFEWRAIKGRNAKQPYAIAMKDGALFGIAGVARADFGRVDSHVRHHHHPVVPENSIRPDSRAEAESAHHAMRCLSPSTCLQRS